LRVLQEGGNAVDAAIAANAVLQVVYPHNCHIGGDLFAIVWDPKGHVLTGLNASGPSAGGATIEGLRASGFETMPVNGVHSITVPGCVAGWHALRERYGSRELDELLRPAATYARHGAPISAKYARYVQIARPLLELNEGARGVFLNGAERPGDLLRQPAFAETLERVGRRGRDGFYKGPVANDIVRSLQALGSTMTHADLESYEPEWVRPLRLPYHGYQLVELPPNTSGVAALLMANIVKGWPVSEFGHTTAAGIHAYVEAKKRAFSDLDRWVSDPRVVDVPVERFTDERFAARHREAIDLERASTPAATPAQDGDTVYLCAVDRDGLAISLIQSVFGGFGSGVVAPTSGVLFHNRGASFTLDPEHPNALAPGKRPRHTLIPAMLLRDGEPAVIFGTMGGDGQSQTHLQLLLGLVNFGLDPQEAIETPRWRHSTTVDGQSQLRIENRVGPLVIADLKRYGHTLDVVGAWHEAMGHAQMIAIDRARGVLGGAADPRGDGSAAGW
jgi:gamma-glutamyltranspeptidase/glutathione hydrolase